MNRHTAISITQKVWSLAHVLKDDGLAFMDYTEQISYLLFLKMMSEQRGTAAEVIPTRYRWETLLAISDDASRLKRYHQGLRKLSERAGLTGLIFTKPQSKISDPAKLGLLMRMIDSENWSALDADVKGEVYEGLLARNADDVRGGAGQYFTPRPVVRAIVQVMQLKVSESICDPACGTGGFLLAAHEDLSRKATTPNQRDILNQRTLHGIDLVSNVAKLCAMNLFIRGIGTNSEYPPIEVRDSLERTNSTYDVVLTNPPFGKKSSVTIVGADGDSFADKLSYKRDDFWATTSNKQLNFVQHVFTLLTDGGRAAVVVPDNVLFEGGAGERIRRSLMKYCDLHTILRLPAGIWYSPSVKANVLFFDKPSTRAFPATKDLWIYDLRSDQKFSLRENPIRSSDLEDFVRTYCAEDRRHRKETERFRRFSYDDIITRDKANLDISWKNLNSVVSSGSPEEILREILNDLGQAMDEFSQLAGLLNH